MEFQTLSFLFIFLPFSVCGYYVLRKTRYANLFMLVVSLYFYAAAEIWYIAPLAITALLDFYIGQRIAASGNHAVRRNFLVISIVANLAFLSVFKYTTWLSGHAAALAAMYGVALVPLVVLLPPGISFYTFQSMSYTVDIYRKEFYPYKNVVDYLSFVAFFPHLVAGPMMRARDLLPQLARRRPVPDADTITHGLFLILFGLFVKTVVADNVGGIVENLERTIPATGGGSMPPGVGLVWAYAFTFQIYCDFSAYSTIARGIAKLFGVELMRNFHTPYFATNPSDFWQRWHISLSTWIRDYLYIPLGGNRGTAAKVMRNLVLTMFLGGLWHGAGVLFIVWGLYHGILLVIYRLFPIDDFLRRRFGRAGHVLSIVTFFHLVVIGWIFFRAQPQHLSYIFGSILALPGAVVGHIHSYLPYFHQLPGLNSAINHAATAANMSSWMSIFITDLRGVLSLWLATLRGTVTGFVVANWYMFVFGWGLFLFSAPAIVTDYLGRRKNVEFGDLYGHFPLVVNVALIIVFFYSIVFLGRRQAVEFLYFAF